MSIAKGDQSVEHCPNLELYPDNEPGSADQRIDLRAREIGLRPTIAYIPEPADAHVCAADEVFFSDKEIRRKDRARKNKERAEKERAGFLQFNRYIATSMRQQAGAFFARLETTDDWAKAILGDPAAIEILNTIGHVTEQLNACRNEAAELAEIHQLRTKAAEVSQQEGVETHSRLAELDKSYREVLARGAVQQLELEELRPLAQRAEHLRSRMDQLEFAEHVANEVRRCRGWRRVLLRMAGIAPDHSWLT